MKQVPTGIALTQTVSSARNTKQIVAGGDLNEITDAVIRTCVRSTVAVNLQCLHRYFASKACWAYSIVFDTATDNGDAYLEHSQRLRLEKNRQIFILVIRVLFVIPNG